jgi:uncharacterized membrane protein
MHWKTRALIVLGFLGIIISVYLTLKAHDPASVACSIGGSCEKVLSSKYAWLVGLPISAYGIFWYLAALILVYLTFIQQDGIPSYYTKTWSAVGLLFSLGLLYVEAFIIHAYCTWCMASLVVVALIFILIWFTNNPHERR